MSGKIVRVALPLAGAAAITAAAASTHRPTRVAVSSAGASAHATAAQVAASLRARAVVVASAAATIAARPTTAQETDLSPKQKLAIFELIPQENYDLQLAVLSSIIEDPRTEIGLILSAEVMHITVMHMIDSPKEDNFTDEEQAAIEVVFQKMNAAIPTLEGKEKENLEAVRASIALIIAEISTANNAPAAEESTAGKVLQVVAVISLLAILRGFISG